MNTRDNQIAPARDRAFLAAGVCIAAMATLLPLGAEPAYAQNTAGDAQEAKTLSTRIEQELLQLSKDKWRWMAERKVDSLDALFHEKAVFVHMGGTMSKKQELDTIRGGGIQYKNTEIQAASVQVIGSTAIVLNTIRLTAVVGGNEVVNPFVVTEVYVKQAESWKLASLSFTRTLR